VLLLLGLWTASLSVAVAVADVTMLVVVEQEVTFR